MITADSEVVARLRELKKWMQTNLDYMEYEQETCDMAIAALTPVPAVPVNTEPTRSEVARGYYCEKCGDWHKKPLCDTKQMTKDNVAWTVTLESAESFPLRFTTGRGWDAFREAVVELKAKADEDHGHIVVATWGPDEIHQWRWNSAHDAPAYLPQWQE